MLIDLGTDNFIADVNEIGLDRAAQPAAGADVADAPVVPGATIIVTNEGDLTSTSTGEAVGLDERIVCRVVLHARVETARIATTKLELQCFDVSISAHSTSSPCVVRDVNERRTADRCSLLTTVLRQCCLPGAIDGRMTIDEVRRDVDNQAP
ncbi:MAG TPA: hypothetical protein VGF99_09010 [Myxococcota bacterium]